MSLQSLYNLSIRDRRYFELTVRIALVIVFFVFSFFCVGCEVTDRFYKMEMKSYEQQRKIEDLERGIDSLKIQIQIKDNS